MERRIWPNDQPPVPPQEPLPADAPLHDKVVAAVKRVYDPEIPVNIYDLGLIYKIDANPETGRVYVQMTLTSPHCPEAESIPGKVRSEIERVAEVKEAEIDLVWSPPWDKHKMSEDAKLILGMV